MFGGANPSQTTKHCHGSYQQLIVSLFETSKARHEERNGYARTDGAKLGKEWRLKLTRLTRLVYSGLLARLRLDQRLQFEKARRMKMKLFAAQFAIASIRFDEKCRELKFCEQCNFGRMT